MKRTGGIGLRVSTASLVVITIFIDITGYGVVIPLLPFYAASLGAGSVAFGLLLAVSSIMQFLFAPLLGRLSDRVGRKPILLLSILFSTTSFIVFAMADSFVILLVSRVLAGVASETAIAHAIMADLTVDKEKERIAGIGRIGAAYGWASSWAL